MRPSGSRRLLLLALACAILSRPAAAQSPVDGASDGGPPSSITRLIRRFGPDSGPVRPLVGVVVPGAGVSAGASVEWPSITGQAFGVGGEGLISVRNYQHLLVRSGYLAQRRLLPELRAADAPITSFMDAGRREPGAAIYVEHRYRRLPSLAYFALAGHDPLRTDFGLTRTTTDLVGQWAASPSLGGAMRVGVMTTRAFDGTDDQRPNTHQTFGRALADGDVGLTRYVTAGIGVSVNRRDDAVPAAGWMLQAAATGFGSTTARAPSFVRLAVDARAHRRVGVARHVMAAQALLSADLADGGRSVPYYLQQTLGGSSTLRAFDSYRVRGTQLLHLGVESRWRVAKMIEIAPFVDAGRVRGGALADGVAGWLVAPGIGVRIRYKQLVVGRLDVARGREGYRLAYAFDAVF